MSKTETTAKPPVLWKEEIKRAWREMRGLEATPSRAALAVAVGVWIGSQPYFFGLHTVIVITLCLVLQLDAVIACLASNISIPFIAPFLLTAEVQIGGYVWTGKRLPFDLNTARAMGISGFFGYACLGAVILGTGLALGFGGLTFVGVWIRRRFGKPAKKVPYVLPDNAPPWWHAIERVARRYAPVPEESTPADRTRFHYVRIKMLTDPVVKMVADHFGAKRNAFGQVLDIGTGRGQLPIVLLELGRAEAATAVDWDEDKVVAARKAAALDPPLAATFAVGDVREHTYEAADTVMLIDVVHYMGIVEQDDLLKRAAAAVRPGGTLLLRDADTERGWRSWVTLAEEKIFTFLRFNRGAKVQFRPAADMVSILEGCGLTCDVRPAWGATPFANVLIVAERPAEED